MPTSIVLPGRQHATIRAVGTDRAGRLEPPDRVTDIGWWTGGAALGSSAGTVVLVGHVDAASQGQGFFARLRYLRPGQDLTVRGAGGRSVRYRITGRRTYPRSQALPSEVFATDVAARLALITCTGRFDAQTAHYSDSLIVYAVPLPAPGAA